MSAVVCGKRSFFEDLPGPPVSKRIRCSSSSSPVRYSPPRPSSSSPDYSPPSSLLSPSAPLLQHLTSIFPDMDNTVLERALEECGGDLDSAIKSLNELRIGAGGKDMDSSVGNSNVAPEANIRPQSNDIMTSNGEASSLGDPFGQQNPPVNGGDWVDLFVKEMMSASNMDDARIRASRALEVLEKSVYTRASVEASKNFQQENMTLKEQMESLIQENSILKRAVSIQHEHQKGYDDKSQELQQLKQLVSQYQEQLRTLEVNNYALMMHLKQAQQSSSMPGRFHPDVF